MKKILSVIFLLFQFSLFGQNFFTGVFGGVANYQGELQTTPFSFTRAKPAYGLNLSYELNAKFLIRFDFTNGRVSGDDKYSVTNRSRNLCFTSNISEFSLGLEYLFLDLYQYKVSPYIFVQGGIFNFSPYYMLPNGAKITLYEFDTEGQGFYQDRKKYNLRQFCLPFGGGVQWAITDNKRIGFIVGFRKTYTDYIDDVSTTYIDKDLLIQKKGVSALPVAYKGDQLPNGDPYPAEGTKRGDPSNNDSYYFAGVVLKFRINAKRNKKEPTQKIEKSRVTCPTVF